MRLPVRLGTQPLVDSTIEIRLTEFNQHLVERIPAIIFSKMSEYYSQSESTPIASLPIELRKSDKNLQFTHSFRIHGPGYVISIGDQVLGISKLMPYSGWSTFKDRAVMLFSALIESELINRISRYSIKATNVLVDPTVDQLDMIAISADLGGHRPNSSGFRMRAEYGKGDFLQLVEIVTNAAFTNNDIIQEGLLVSVDSIKFGDDLDLRSVIDGLDFLHDEGKRRFFDILTEDTIRKLKPEYE